ncbi:hypothetical protein CCS92_35550, partial [Methylobacterium radiotolerans]
MRGARHRRRRLQPLRSWQLPRPPHAGRPPVGEYRGPPRRARPPGRPPASPAKAVREDGVEGKRAQSRGHERRGPGAG